MEFKRTKGSGSGSGSGSAVNKDNPKRRTVLVACNTCRARKAKCDGERPVCTPCRGRNGPSQCSYDANDGESRAGALRRENLQLRNERDSLNTAFEKFKNMPENEAVAYFIEALRSSTPLDTLARTQFDEASAQDQVIQAPTPANVNKFQHELTELFCWAYPSLVPVPFKFSNMTFKDSWELFAQEESSAESARQLYELRGFSQEESPAAQRSHRTSDSEQLFSIGQRYLGPPLPSHFFKVDWMSLDIAFWTRVPVTSEQVLRWLPLYFEAAHSFSGFFDAELFLEDLISKRGMYCSSFLINAVLFNACLYNSKVDETARNMKYHFAAEAERLWSATRFDSDHITRLSATLVLSIAFSTDGADRKGMYFSEQAIAMAERMDVFCETEESIRRYQTLTDEEARAQSYAAWGLFTFNTLRSFYYRTGVPKQAPTCPIPGEDWAAPTTLPYYVGATFAAWCQFSVIILPLARTYSDKNATLGERYTVHDAEAKYMELLKWSITLTDKMARVEKCLHHVLFFHILFHTTVMDIFRPFLAQPTELQSFTAVNSTPRTVFDASLAQLKRLTIIYHSTYPEASYAIQIHHAALYIFNALLSTPNDPEWNFYYMLCVHTYFTLAKTWRLARIVLSAILNMAVEHGKMSLKEARGIFRKLPKEVDRLPVDDMQAVLIVDQAKALLDQSCEEAKADTLSEGLRAKFAEGDREGVDGDIEMEGGVRGNKQLDEIELRGYLSRGRTGH